MNAPTLLCVDGGSQRLVVAAVRGDQVFEASSDASAAHGMAILGLVDEVSARASVDKKVYDAIVISGGPGSFTGLRTALSTMKGVALGLGKPIISIPTLHALARSGTSTQGSLISCCMDARKGEVYGAVYRLGDAPALDEIIVEPAVMPPGDWAAKVRAVDGKMAWSGDGAARFPEAFAGMISVSVWQHAYAQMHALALCGIARMQHPDDLQTLEPVYIRRSYTDLSLGKKDLPRSP